MIAGRNIDSVLSLGRAASIQRLRAAVIHPEIWRCTCVSHGRCRELPHFLQWMYAAEGGVHLWREITAYTEGNAAPPAIYDDASLNFGICDTALLIASKNNSYVLL